MNIANTYITFFYNMLLGYALYYMVMSFTSVLPWEKCNPLWASTSNWPKKNSTNIYFN